MRSHDTEGSLRHGTKTAWGFVGTQQGVAGLTPRPFTLGEETGSHHGHGRVHRTRMLICMHKWGSSTVISALLGYCSFGFMLDLFMLFMQ